MKQIKLLNLSFGLGLVNPLIQVDPPQLNQPIANITIYSSTDYTPEGPFGFGHAFISIGNISKSTIQMGYYQGKLIKD